MAKDAGHDPKKAAARAVHKITHQAKKVAKGKAGPAAAAHGHVTAATGQHPGPVTDTGDLHHTGDKHDTHVDKKR